MQVSSTTNTVHVLLCLDLDDHIVWYNTVKVCVERLGELLELKLHVAILVCLCMCTYAVFSVTKSIQ